MLFLRLHQASEIHTTGGTGVTDLWNQQPQTIERRRQRACSLKRESLQFFIVCAPVQGPFTWVRRGLYWPHKESFHWPGSGEGCVYSPIQTQTNTQTHCPPQCLIHTQALLYPFNFSLSLTTRHSVGTFMCVDVGTGVCACVLSMGVCARCVCLCVCVILDLLKLDWKNEKLCLSVRMCEDTVSSAFGYFFWVLKYD